MQNSRKHFNGGRFSRTIWTDERDRLPFWNTQADSIHRHHFGLFALSTPATTKGKVFAEFVYLNSRHHSALKPMF
jgi:hypothetical protein